MRITWINHASYLLEASSVRLVSDPWLEGSAFNNGWQLLSETQYPYERFADVTHIWFSHEHPDHFSPQVLKKISAQHRTQITVLYRKTRDGRVANFCRKAGFQVIELDPWTEHVIGADLRIVCGPVASDSWLWVDDGATTALNVNDCVLSSPAQLRRLHSACPRVDVLFTSSATRTGAETGTMARLIGQPPVAS